MAASSRSAGGVRRVPQNTVRNGPAKDEVVQSIQRSALARSCRSTGWNCGAYFATR
ncbi:hypothetical protein D9M72_611440 [compost metagenome]